MYVFTKHRSHKQITKQDLKL